MVWRRHTWQMCATRSRLSSAGGSCGRQTVGHSSFRAQGPRSVAGTLPWLARSLGTASPSTCGLHHYPKIHLRKNSKLIYLAASTLEVFSNLALYKLTYSFIPIHMKKFTTSVIMILNKWSSRAFKMLWHHIPKLLKPNLVFKNFPYLGKGEKLFQELSNTCGHPESKTGTYLWTIQKCSTDQSVINDQCYSNMPHLWQQFILYTNKTSINFSHKIHYYYRQIMLNCTISTG